MYQQISERDKKTLTVSASKPPITSRYFIELHAGITRETSRAIIDQMRRHQALEFMRSISEWLRDNRMSDDVTSLSVTAMGQVMIVCTPAVIDQIRDQDVFAVAHIRSSDQFSKLTHVGRA